jgi:hypothetical protein
VKAGFVIVVANRFVERIGMAGFRWRRVVGVAALLAVVFGGTAGAGAAQAGPVPVEQLRWRAALGLADGDVARARALAGSLSCWQNVTIRAANGLYVKADFGVVGVDKGLLRAATPKSAIGAWELFYVCRDPADWRTYLMSQYNGLPYVNTETSAVDYPGVRYGLLRAGNYGDHGKRNYFSTFTVPASNGPLGAGNGTWFWSWWNELYVSAQLDYPDASLRARLGVVGPWEQFSWSGITA